jgi:uncharacterized protein YecE (DUF72 family)
MSEDARIWIGTSGFVYRHWRKGVFYPEGLKQREELGYYAARFDTVELNNPFYRLPTPEMFVRWREGTPDGFRFAVKASRYITHIKRLQDVGDEVALLMERAELLGPKLGPVLFQLPPNQHIDLPRLQRFLGLLGPDHQWVVEFRHPSWHVAETYRLLSSHAVALCIPVGGGLHPDHITTAPFTYIRMHRGEEPAGGFSRKELKLWSGRIRALADAGKEIYLYFNNDWEGFAIRDAVFIERLLGQSSHRVSSSADFRRRGGSASAG